MSRKAPNIIITGTPGVGKTSHCELLAKTTGLKHISINQIIKDKNCHEGWSDEFQSYMVDEDKLLDALEDDVKPGGFIIDWHACDLFPESWIDLVIVLRSGTEQLYDRLKARDYSDAKLQENIDSEIMEVLLSEARESYASEIVIELQSNDTDDLDSNIERIESWITNWKEQHHSD